MADEVKVYLITNEEINMAMQGGMSLNALEALHFARLLDSLESDVKRIYLDSPDVLQHKFGVRVGLFSKKTVAAFGAKSKQEGAIRMISEHKADEKYPVVSGSSIISKVTRDREVDKIKAALGINFGSGYPADKHTVEALRLNIKTRKLEPYLRQKWNTLANIRQLRMKEFTQ